MKKEIQDFIEPQIIELLKACDYTRLDDVPISNVKRAEWQEYRQALRDMNKDQDPETVEDVVWPTPPTED